MRQSSLSLKNCFKLSKQTRPPLKSDNKNSPGVTSYDIRHYLKLFRSLVFSPKIGSFDNIGKMYYAIHGLILDSESPMTESSSYLFNLFDNNTPNKSGNTLIRYRVLEYCKLFHDLTEIFDYYFNALGCDPDDARLLLKLFADTGLIHIVYRNENDKLVPESAQLTIAGYRHIDLVSNLWYMICIKTGMYIDKEYILFGDEARSYIEVFTKSKSRIDDYSKHGWVPEEKFIEFIGSQQYIEQQHVDNFQEEHAELATQVTNMYSQVARLYEAFHYSYHEQIVRWNSHRRSSAYRENI